MLLSAGGLLRPVLLDKVTISRVVFTDPAPKWFAWGYPLCLPRLLRIESPRISMRWALCTSRSSMPSASVGSPICSGHGEVERKPQPSRFHSKKESGNGPTSFTSREAVNPARNQAEKEIQRAEQTLNER